MEPIPEVPEVPETANLVQDPTPTQTRDANVEDPIADILLSMVFGL